MSGSGLKLADNSFRDDRWEAGIAVNGIYSIAPGLALSAGGLLNQDEIDFISERIGGAYVEGTYQNKTITSFIRARYLDVAYLNDPQLPTGLPVSLIPFFRGSAFDARRNEVSAGILYGNNKWLAPYAEFAAADVNYHRQPNEAVIDRDSEDYYGKGGLRITPSPFLQADIGWRWNWRELEDPGIRAYNSDYFDASLTWRPSPYFSLTGAIDRTIGEPSASFSRLADIKAYSLGLTYLPVERWSYKILAKRENIDEIGDVPLIRRRRLTSEVSYTISPFAQFYTNFYYEHVNEDRSDLSYDRYKMSLGTRFIFGAAPENSTSSSIKDGGAVHEVDASHLRLPRGAKLDLSVGYSWMDLPGTYVTTLVGGNFFDEALGRIEDHDGELDGFRIDARLRDVAQHSFNNGHWYSFSVGGFYARYESEQQSSCFFTATTDCAFVNIVDFDSTQENNTGPFGKLVTTTNREVHYWGVEVDARLGRWAQGGLKDGGGYKYLSPFRVGLGIRALNQSNRLHAIDVSVPDPIDYNEDLDTYYYGGFLGYEREFGLGRGFSLGVDAQAGVYYAHTTYEGRYVAYIPLGGPVFVVERGGLDAGMDEAAFIGGLTVDLKKDLGWSTLSIFGKGEYLSHVPKVLTNNNDEAGGSPFGVRGTQTVTKLTDDDAVSWTVGARLSIPIK